MTNPHLELPQGTLDLLMLKTPRKYYEMTHAGQKQFGARKGELGGT